MASGAQDVNHLDELYDGRTPDILDNAFVIVDYPSGARALLDLCMFAEATDEQEEMSVVGELGKVEARLPSNTVRRRAARRALDRRRRELHRHRRADRLRGLAPRLELHRARPVRRGDPHAAAGPEVTLDDGYWAVAVGVAAHRSIELGRPVELTEIDETNHATDRTECPHDASRWRGSAPCATTTTSSSASPTRCSPARWEHCRNIVLTADRYGFDNVLLPVGLRARHRQHRVRRRHGTD